MSEDKGSSQDSGRQPVSALLSAECEVWIVEGVVGEWSDRTEWIAAAFWTEGAAKGFVQHIEQQSGLLKPFDDDDYDALAKWEEAMRAIEPSFSTYCGEPPLYRAFPIAVRADGALGRQDGQLRDESPSSVPVITEEMVERAAAVLSVRYHSDGEATGFDRHVARATLTAALTPKET